jgi:hypothetical protein
MAEDPSTSGAILLEITMLCLLFMSNPRYVFINSTISPDKIKGSAEKENSPVQNL